MATYDGVVLGTLLEHRIPATSLLTSPASIDEVRAVLLPDILSSGDLGDDGSIDGEAYDGVVMTSFGTGLDWFNKIHAVPKKLELGTVVSAQNVDIELVNTFDNGLGYWVLASGASNANGITLSTGYSDPTVIKSFDSFTFQVEVSNVGTTTISGSLDFVSVHPLYPTVSSVYTTSIPVSGSRIFLPTITRPELPIRETLEFLTDIIPHRDKTEQCIAVRKNPRQFLEYTFILSNTEVAGFENLLLGAQDSRINMPVWFEEKRTIADSPAGTDQIFLPDIDSMTLAVGGIVLISQVGVGGEAQTISAIDGGTITLASTLGSSFTENASVLPVKTVWFPESVRSERFKDTVRVSIKFRVDENDLLDPSDTSAWDSLNGKLLIDDANVISTSSFSEQYTHDILVIDGLSGKAINVSGKDYGRRTHPKTFLSKSPEDLWRIRGLVYALRGRQKSFYLPTFFDKDLVATSALTSNTMTITSAGYALRSARKTTRDYIRVTETDGTEHIREITEALDLGTSEAITVDSAWPYDIPASEISRIEILELVRMASDTVTINHLQGNGVAQISFPVTSAFN